MRTRSTWSRTWHYVLTAAAAVLVVGCPPPPPPQPSVLQGSWETAAQGGAKVTVTFNSSGQVTQLAGEREDGATATLSITGSTSTVQNSDVTFTVPLTATTTIEFEGTLSNDNDTMTGTLTGEIELSQGAVVITIPGGDVTLRRAGTAECAVDADCDAGEVCSNGTCVDPCAGVTCDEGETCEGGECVAIVAAAVEGDPVPGGSLTAAVTVNDGSTIQSVAWQQSNSVSVNITSPNAASTQVLLPNAAAYKAELINVLLEPPISEDQLPPNVPLPEDGFVGGLQDRFQVVGLNPFALEEAGLVTLEVAVTTTSGEYSAQVAIHAELPWKVAPGLYNVPTGRAVLLYGKTQDAYDWVLTAPAGSSANLTDATSQAPYFVPDASGKYTVTVTNTTADPAEVVTLDIYAGTWQGAITGQDASGRPVATDCMGCHNGGIAADKFTPWAQTGHAEIFTDNLNTSTHYGESCFVCHTVGFDPDVDNGGVDDAADYQAFLDAGLINTPSDDNWTTVLSNYSDTARLANAQCENCHGPNNTALHPNTILDPQRISFSADVCATCHGEPLRHGRYEQWQLSGHANYELAVDEGDNGSCARCHTVNGFLAWLPVLLGDEPGDPLASVDVTWTPDQTHPQTCVTCHDPHSVGTTTGVETDVTVRISGDTPPLIAGFTATDVGNGAMCMTCHNTRRGLRNDDTWPDTLASGDTATSPHQGAQADVLMGQNAYFVTVGNRGSHSLIDDTCVNCHMEQTPPPDLLSYNSGGTNHTFFARSDICSACHSFGPEVVQPGVQAKLDQLQERIEDAFLAEITRQIDAGNTVSLDGQRIISDPADIADIEFGESRGQQAITVTFTDDAVVGPTRLSAVKVIDADDADIGALYALADERLPKSGWNWNLVDNDLSKGVHNPSFANDVLDAAIDALEALAAE